MSDTSKFNVVTYDGSVRTKYSNGDIFKIAGEFYMLTVWSGVDTFSYFTFIDLSTGEWLGDERHGFENDVEMSIKINSLLAETGVQTHYLGKCRIAISKI